MEKEYFLGLDMGTGSVGWAVTDNRYEVLRSHGKALWGVRLFESANTAEERRMFRTARRRLDRRNWRIQILQELFAEEIAAVDPGFYLRMKESKYYPEDKRDTKGNCPDLPYALFVDRNYRDKGIYVCKSSKLSDGSSDAGSNERNEISEYKRLVHRESTKELHGRGETVYYRCRQM